MVDNDAPGSGLHPYGAGSHAVLDSEREMPGCYPIKGNVRNDGTKLYHRPDSRNYGATVAEVWFDSPSAAEAAGFELAPTHPRGSTGVEYEPGRSGHPCTAEQVMANRASAPGGALSGAGFVLGSAVADSERHPYGIGSHALLDNEREAPGCYPIKGNVRNDGTKLYHRPDSRNYGATVAEVWFDSPSAAEAAGFELAPTHPRGSTGVEYEPGRSGHPCTMAEVDEQRAESAGLVVEAAGGGQAGLPGVVLGADAIDTERHPYGIGSHALLDDAGEIPECYPIKGNIRNDGSKLYHRPDSRSYAATRAEAWFDSPSAAEAAGFVLAPTHPRDSSAADFEPGGAGHPCTVDVVNANRAAAAGVALDDTDDSSSAGKLAAAGAAGAALTGAAALAGLGDDDGSAGAGAEPAARGDDVAGPSGDPLAGAAGVSAAAGDAAARATRSVDDVAGPSGDVLAGAADRAAEEAGVDRDTDGSAEGDAGGGADDDGGSGLGTAAGVAAAAAGAAGLAAAASRGGEGDAAEEVKDAADDAVTAGKDKAEDAVTAGKDKAEEAAGAAKGKAEEAAGAARGKAEDAARAGKDRAGKAKGKAKAGAAAAAGAAAGAAAAGSRNREEIEKGIASARAGVDSRADKVPSTVGQARSAAGKAAAGGGDRAATLAGRAGGDGGGFGLGRWLWMGLGLLALVLILGWLLSRCGDDDDGSAAAGGDDTETVDPAGPDTDDAAATDDTAAEDTTTTTEAEEDTTTTTEAPDLQALAVAALADAGFGDVEVEVDGDSVRLVGELGSEDDRTAAEAAIAALEGVGGVTNEITVAGETPAADATEGDPSYTG